jgi:hypothetical protein
MMQTAKARHRDNFTRERRLLCRRSAVGSLLRQPEMCSVVVVVPDVIGHQSLEMMFVEHNHMVEQIAATAANEALGHAILPGTSVAGPLGLDAKALHSFDYIAVKVRAAIEDQMAGRSRFRATMVAGCI